MIVRIFLIISTISLSLSVATEAATTPQIAVLKPTSNWNVDYADKECRLTRTFGENDAQIFFRLARGTSWVAYDMMLAGVAIPKQSGSVDIDVKFEGDAAAQSFKGENRGIPNRKERVIRWYDGDITDLLSGSKNQKMQVTSDRTYSVGFDLGNFPAAIKAMQACHDDLLAGWGVDVPALRGLKSAPQPKPSMSGWATNKDYPRSLIANKIDGEVSFLMDVDVAGSPTGCRVVISSNSSELDRLSCDLVMKRAKFSPAIGQDGLAVASQFITRIRWMLPE